MFLFFLPPLFFSFVHETTTTTVMMDCGLHCTTHTVEENPLVVSRFTGYYSTNMQNICACMHVYICIVRVHDVSRHGMRGICTPRCSECVRGRYSIPGMECARANASRRRRRRREGWTSTSARTDDRPSGDFVARGARPADVSSFRQRRVVIGSRVASSRHVVRGNRSALPRVPWRVHTRLSAGKSVKHGRGLASAFACRVWSAAPAV